MRRIELLPGPTSGHLSGQQVSTSSELALAREFVKWLLARLPSTQLGVRILCQQKHKATAADILRAAKEEELRATATAAATDDPRNAERLVKHQAEGGSLIVVLHDAFLQTASDVIHLAGTSGLTPLECWARSSGVTGSSASKTGNVTRLIPGTVVSVLSSDSQCSFTLVGPVDGDTAGIQGAPGVGSHLATASLYGIVGIEGTFTADLSFSVNRPWRISRNLQERNIKLSFGAGSLESLSCDDKQLEQLLGRARTLHGVRRVGVLGLGLKSCAWPVSDVDGPANQLRDGVGISVFVEEEAQYLRPSRGLVLTFRGRGGHE